MRKTQKPMFASSIKFWGGCWTDGLWSQHLLVEDHLTKLLTTKVHTFSDSVLCTGNNAQEDASRKWTDKALDVRQWIQGKDKSICLRFCQPSMAPLSRTHHRHDHGRNKGVYWGPGTYGTVQTNEMNCFRNATAVMRLCSAILIRILVLLWNGRECFPEIQRKCRPTKRRIGRPCKRNGELLSESSHSIFKRTHHLTTEHTPQWKDQCAIDNLWNNELLLRLCFAVNQILFDKRPTPREIFLEENHVAVLAQANRVVSPRDPHVVAFKQ